MNGFEVTHPLKATDHTVLLVYGMSMDMKIFTFRLPGECVPVSVGLNQFLPVSPAPRELLFLLAEITTLVTGNCNILTEGEGYCKDCRMRKCLLKGMDRDKVEDIQGAS